MLTKSSFLTVFLAFSLAMGFSSQSSAQLVSPQEKELVPDSGSPLVEFDISLDELNRSLLGCVLKKEKRDVLQAYVSQLLSSDFGQCSHADYATNSQVRSYIQLLANSSSIDRAEACQKTDNFFQSVFAAMNERIVTPEKPCGERIITCTVRARGNLNFRSFPHVADQPITEGHELTKKGQVLDGANVLIEKDYRGWSYVAAVNTADSSFTAGWVSNFHLINCR